MTSLTFALVMLTLNADPVGPAPAATPAGPPDARKAVERGLVYLEKHKQAFGCVSCHDGAWMIWSHHEAEKRGFTINRKSLDLLRAKAVKDYGGHPEFKPTGMDKGHDLSINTMYLSVALGSAPAADPQVTALLDRFAAYLVKKQMADGHWQVHANGGESSSPPLDDRHDSTTMWAVLALTAQPHAGALQDEVDRSTEKARKWLRENPSSGMLQSAMLRVLLAKRLGTAEELRAAVKELRDRQNADGGWSQSKVRPSDALGTGQALVALTTAGATVEDPAVAKARAFLLGSQKPDGSWYVLTRQGGEYDRKNFRAASYQGTAWAVIGLVRAQSGER